MAKSQLYILLDNEFIGTEAFEKLFEQASLAKSQLNGLIKYLRTSELRGSKYQLREPELAEFTVSSH